MSRAEVLRLSGVTHRREGRTILHDVDWQVHGDERWVLMGPNGSGKTTLARMASLWLHPSEGTVVVLGETLGRTDVRALRRRVSFVSAAMADLVRPALRATEVVMCAKYGALEPWWHSYSEDDRARAARLLGEQGLASMQERSFGTLSSGERQRVLLARALMAEPELVVLDEPAAGLDLGGREELLERLDSLAADPAASPVLLVTHHVEEIPPRFTHLLVVARGSVLAAGAIEDTLDAELLSEAFGIPVALRSTETDSGVRWSAHRR
ncbi:MAG: ATP-binding cassette domain-containing protein [Microthrixaceae bacterium]